MKFKKKLFLSIMTLALVVVTLSTSTFAWFTLGNTANIEQVKVNVTTGLGIEISENGDAWKNKINLSAPTDLIDFTALSSYTGTNNLKGKEGVVLYDRNGEVVSFKKVDQLQNNEKNSFFEKEVYIRITATPGATSSDPATADCDWIALKNVTSGTELDFGEAVGGEDKDHANANQWMADFDYTGDKTYENGKFYNFDALNAVKISFATVREDENHAKAEVATVLYGYANDNNQGDVSLNGAAKAYADFKEYAYALPNDTDHVDAVGEPGDTDYVAEVQEVKGTLPTYVSDLTTAAKILLQTDFVDADTAKAADGILANKVLDENYMYAKVTIRIWLDGWDADCINAILDQNTTLSIVLEAFKNE